MKKIIFFLSFLFFASFLSVPVFGETFDEIIEKQKQEFGLEDLEHSQPPETELFYEEPLALDGLSEILSPQKILFSVGNALVGAVTENKGFVYGLLLILAAEVILRILSDLYPSSTVLGTVETLLMFSAVLVLCEGLLSSVGTFEKSIENLSSFSVSLMPVVSGLVSSTGRPAFGTFSSSFVFFLTEFFSFLLIRFAAPCTKVFLAAGIGGGLADNSHIHKFSSLCRNILIASGSFLFCLFIGIFSLHSADSLAKQSMKFAAGNFIPVAGGYIGETLETFYTCAAGLKNSSGCFGILVIFSLIVLPAADLFVKYLILRIAESLSAVFENKALVSFFSVSKDAFSVLFSVTVGYGAMLMLMLAIFMKSG